MMQESDDIELLIEVASLYYEKNHRQDEIARMVGTSRSGVSRMLARARVLGLIDIHVHHQVPMAPELSEALVGKFPLLDALVLRCPALGEYTVGEIGALAANYVDRRIQRSFATEHPVRRIGVSWGLSILELVKALRPRSHPMLDVIQIMGSVDMTKMVGVDAPEVTRRFAAVYGARCHYMRAPLFVENALVRDGLLKERGLRRVFQLMEQMDIALVGVGGIRPDAPGLFHTGYFSEHKDLVRRLVRRQAVGDICGNYFRIDGTLCAPEVLERLVSVSLETLHKVPLVIGLVTGEGKAQALLGALRTGVINVLITDDTCARALLQLVEEEQK